MNGYVFAYPGAPLKDMRITSTGRQIIMHGVMHKGVDIQFAITATPDLTADGRIRLHPTAIKIFGVNGEKLMKALGLRLDKLLDLGGAKGISVSGNDLLLDASELLPPPRIKGRITRVRVESEEVVQTFSDSTATRESRLAAPDTSAANYMSFAGGTLRFGRLSMAQASMQIVDLHPVDPFDFDLSHYQTQLVAGYSKTLADGGLEVFMPDAGRAK